MTDEGFVKHFDDENFAGSIAKGVTLVDFHADWCGPCRMMAPIVKQLAENMKGKVSVGKVDVDNAQQTASTYQVTSIPTIILFKDGKEVQRVVGVKDANTLEKMINAAL